MSAYSQRENALATKVVGFYPENKGEPTHPSDIMLYSAVNGSLQAVSQLFLWFSLFSSQIAKCK